MAIQRTLSIIKPDAVAKNVVGEIISRFEKNNLKIIAAKLITLSASDAVFMLSIRVSLFMMI